MYRSPPSGLGEEPEGFSASQLATQVADGIRSTEMTTDLYLGLILQPGWPEGRSGPPSAPLRYFDILAPYKLAYYYYYYYSGIASKFHWQADMREATAVPRKTEAECSLSAELLRFPQLSRLLS